MSGWKVTCSYARHHCDSFTTYIDRGMTGRGEGRGGGGGRGVGEEIEGGITRRSFLIKRECVMREHVRRCGMRDCVRR